MASNAQLELVTCSLCYEIYNSSDKVPKGLPCMHTFCLECLHKFVVNKVDFNLLCPLCQAKFRVPRDGVKAIPTNILVVQLLDTLPKPVLATVQTGPRPRSSHHINKAKPSATCCVHERADCEFVCTACYLPLCRECMKNITRGPHATHTLDDLHDVMSEMESEYGQVKQKIEEVKDQCRKATDVVAEGLRHCKDEAVAEVEAEAETAIAKAVQKKQCSLKNIDSDFTELDVALQLVTDKLHAKEGDIRSRLESLEICLQDQDTETGRKILDTLQKQVTGFYSGIPNLELTPGKFSSNYILDIVDTDNPLPFFLIKALHLTPKKPPVNKIMSLDLDAGCNWNVGLGHNTALLSDANKNTITKYKIGQTKVTKKFETVLPGGMETNCCKYSLHNGSIILRKYNGNDPTCVYTPDLEGEQRFTIGSGQLIGTLSPELLVYVKKKYHRQTSEVHIYDVEHQQMAVLAPPDGETWTPSLSVCKHHVTGSMAVTNFGSRTLDIYHKAGHHLERQALHITPLHTSAMCCDERYIYIVQQEPPLLSIYNWAAVHVVDFDHRQLNIKKSDCLHAVGHVRDRVISLAVGSDFLVTSLCVYRV